MNEENESNNEKVRLNIHELSKRQKRWDITVRAENPEEAIKLMKDTIKEAQEICKGE